MGAVVRKFIFWSHLAVGLAAGVTILVMCVTGVLMTYERQIQSIADRAGLRLLPPGPHAQPLPVESVVARVRAAKGIDPEYVSVFSGDRQPVEVYLNRETGSVYADAYTGAIVGEPSSGTAQFFREVRAWHRWLGVRGPNRPKFRALIDASNCVLLFLTVFGLYLWLPRKWTWRHFRAVLLFRPGMAGRARDFNWHNVIGLWAAIPLVLIVWTGMAMSYPWAKRATYRAAGTPIQKPAAESKPASEEHADNAQPVALEARLSGLEPLMARAKRQSPGWKAITLEIPDTVTEPVDFTIDMSGYDAVGKSADLELDRSGNVLSFSAAGSERVTAKSFIRYGHTGELWGVPGQTAAGLATMGGGFLVWTGVSLSFRRLRSWRTRKAKHAAGAAIGRSAGLKTTREAA
jgi:uncharacterized iron-regulated membrane protein